MGKIIKYNEEARELLKQGVDGVADAVSVTLGARGRNVIIDRGQYNHVTKDGVTVAKAIDFEDKFMNMGAKAVKEAANKTCDDAGDGTTTACVLTQAIIKQGMHHVSKGYNPTEIVKGIRAAVKTATGFIRQNSNQVDKNSDRIRSVATVSANNDEIIGNLIANAFKSVGVDGTVTVEEAKSYKTTLSVTDGTKVMSGFYSPYFKDKGRDECVLENPLILVSDKKIENMAAIYPLLEKVLQEERHLLIICEEMGVEPLGSLVTNKLRGNLKSCVIKCPSFGEMRQLLLDDLALLTGAEYLSDDTCDKLSNVEISQLGSAVKVIVDANETVIVNAQGDSNKIAKRVQQISASIEKETDKVKSRNLEIRKSKLCGGIAVLSVGGASETEVREKADRIDDAKHATKAAIQEGIVPGGGIMYMRAAEEISRKIHLSNGGFKKGEEIVIQALKEPFKKILENAGIYPSKKDIKKAMNTDGAIGYDVTQEAWVNMYHKGVIDPAKVLRVALINAASAACMILITECAISEK